MSLRVFVDELRGLVTVIDDPDPATGDWPPLLHVPPGGTLFAAGRRYSFDELRYGGSRELPAETEDDAR